MRIGFIGFGLRAATLVSSFREVSSDFRIAAVADPDAQRVRGRLDALALGYGIGIYPDTETLLDQEELDGVVVATRCSLHARLASTVLARGLPLFLEKPVGTSYADLHLLQEAGAASRSPVLVSFPLRVSPLAVLAKEIVDSGRLGRIENAVAVNDVPYGGVYFHGWYRDERETGGLFLQKATHDLDYVGHLLGRAPAEVCAMTSKTVFRGDHLANLRCEDCLERDTCPEGPYSMKHVRYDDPQGPWCCFASDTGNEDAGAVLVRNEDGTFFSYSQNFYARKGAARRGARLIGYDGTLEFDWYADEIRVWMHSSPRVEVHKSGSAQLAHSGGDFRLAENFIELVRANGAKSAAPLEAGLQSALLCLAARESARTSTFRKVGYLD
jgi:predicted dehydrogenase